MVVSFSFSYWTLTDRKLREFNSKTISQKFEDIVLLSSRLWLLQLWLPTARGVTYLHLKDGKQNSNHKMFLNAHPQFNSNQNPRSFWLCWSLIAKVFSAALALNSKHHGCPQTMKHHHTMQCQVLLCPVNAPAPCSANCCLKHLSLLLRLR